MFKNGALTADNLSKAAIELIRCNMKSQNNGIRGKTVRQSASKGRASAIGRVEQLLGQIENLPIVNAEQVSRIRRQIGTGSYVSNEENAAAHILEIERSFSKQK